MKKVWFITGAGRGMGVDFAKSRTARPRWRFLARWFQSSGEQGGPRKLGGGILPELPGLGTAALDQYNRVGMECYRRRHILKAVLPCGGFALKPLVQSTNTLHAI